MHETPKGLGIDGVFSDFADTAVAARVLHELTNVPGYARCLTGQIRNIKELRACRLDRH